MRSDFKKRLKAGVLILVMFGALLGGCAPKGSVDKPSVTGSGTGNSGSTGTRTLSDSEILTASKSEIANLIASSHVDDRETVFTVEVSGVSGGKVTLTGESSDPSLKKALLDTISAIPGASPVDQIVTLPSSSLGGKTYAFVKVPVLNLGDGPKSSGGSHTVTQARMGDPLELLKEKNGWYLAKMADGYLGWVDPESIYVCDKESFDSWRSGPQALISAKMTSALDSPEGQPLFKDDLVQGSVLPIAASEGGWTKVKIPGGQEAWVPSSGVTVFPDIDSVFAEKKGAQGVIATAKQFLGLPYYWGGTTSYGFDCSGLTQYAFKMNGYQIRRDADMQFEQGEPVLDRKDLKPGDLVFFQTYKKGASHVGIYIGDSRYIQSGGSSGIAILSFDPNAPDYSASLDKAYLGARRIIK